MDEYKDLTDSIRRLAAVEAPHDFTKRVMTAIDKENSGTFARIRSYFFRPLDLSSDVRNLYSGLITSHLQYACLLFFIGVFYFIAGFVTLWGLHDILTNPGLDAWLRYQPFFALISAMLMFALAISIVIFRQKAVLAARNIIIGHTLFIAINALILEFTLYLPSTIIFALILTAPAVLLGIFLISSVQNYIASNLANYEESNCA